MADRPFLILQARPEDEAADEEFASILARGGLAPDAVRRMRLERETLAEIGEVAGVILGGGPGCLSDPPQKKSAEEARIEGAVLHVLPEICARDLPFMGCCYGIGALAHYLGGRVGQNRWPEPVGVTSCRVTQEGRTDPVLAGLPETFDALVGHKEAVEVLPEGCATLVESATCPVQMLRYRKNVYATQFHPEADGESFALRARIYRDRGYFDAVGAERLIAQARDLRAPWTARILANFVARYRSNWR